MNHYTESTASIFKILGSFLLFLVLPLITPAQEYKPTSSDSGLYVKVQLDSKLKVSSLKPGDTVDGTLASNVYWRDREVLPAGSHVRLVVDSLERRRRERNDHWPWVVQAFTPRHEKYPTFHSAQVLLPDGRTVNLEMTFLSVGRETTVRMKSRHSSRTQPKVGNAALPEGGKNGDSRKASAGLTAKFLATADPSALPLDPSNHAPLLSQTSITLAAGTPARIVLLEGASASRNHPGDKIQARLVEPLYVDSVVALPAGTIFEGKVVRSQPPRMLSRSGSLLMSFTAITSPDGKTAPVAASVTGLDLNVRSQTHVDLEGGLHGDRPGVRWMLINLAVTGGMSKAVDDGTQLVLEAIVASATDASTAGTARIVAACVSGIFMLTRHGRDVVLPQYTEMEISFDRPVVFP